MAQLVSRSSNMCPDGFPPGLWVAITGCPTIYMHQERATYPKMFSSAHREQDVKKEYMRDGSVKVIGISEDFINHYKQA